MSDINGNRKRETIEWCQMRWINAPDESLPRVLLVGDSIVGGYYPVVDRLLKGKVNIAILSTSKSINDIGLIKETIYVMDEFRYDCIHFNNGLHGWHIEDDDYMASLDNYLKSIKQLSKGAKLVWASTTPVLKRDSLDVFDEVKNPVVIRRNAIAADLMNKNNIPVNDLYSLLLGKKELYKPDGVHYLNEGYEVLGSAVADVILKQLNY